MRPATSSTTRGSDVGGCRHRVEPTGTVVGHDDPGASRIDRTHCVVRSQHTLCEHWDGGSGADLGDVCPRDGWVQVGARGSAQIGRLEDIQGRPADPSVPVSGRGHRQVDCDHNRPGARLHGALDELTSEAAVLLHIKLEPPRRRGVAELVEPGRAKRAQDGECICGRRATQRLVLGGRVVLVVRRRRRKQDRVGQPFTEEVE